MYNKIDSLIAVDRLGPVLYRVVPVFKKTPRFVGPLGSEPRVLGRLVLGIRV